MKYPYDLPPTDTRGRVVSWAQTSTSGVHHVDYEKGHDDAWVPIWLPPSRAQLEEAKSLVEEAAAYFACAVRSNDVAHYGRAHARCLQRLTDLTRYQVVYRRRGEARLLIAKGVARPYAHRHTVAGFDHCVCPDSNSVWPFIRGLNKE